MKLTTEQIKILEQNKIIPPNCPQAQIDFFGEVCDRKKLDPFVRQIHLVERKSKDTFGKWVASYTIQSGIDGMRAIAQRNCKVKSYRRWVEKREDDLYGICEIDTEDRGKYYDELPFNEYRQTKSDGTTNTFWTKFPQTMIKKCAEESVLRMMAPEDLSGVYGDDEMMQADVEIKDTKLLTENKPALPETRPEVTDFNPALLGCKSFDDVTAIYNTMTDDEKKAYYNLIQITKRRIYKDNYDTILKNMKKNHWTDKKQIDLEDMIEHEDDPLKKAEMIAKLEEKVRSMGFEYTYEKLPWDK